LKAKKGDFDHSEGVILENTPDITRIRDWTGLELDYYDGFSVTDRLR
jgi:hypothetical protein